MLSVPAKAPHQTAGFGDFITLGRSQMVDTFEGLAVTFHTAVMESVGRHTIIPRYGVGSNYRAVMGDKERRGRDAAIMITLESEKRSSSNRRPEDRYKVLKQKGPTARRIAKFSPCSHVLVGD